MDIYVRLLTYIRPYWTRVVVAIFCMILVAAGNLAIPWIIKIVTDDVLIRRDVVQLNIVTIGTVVIFFFRSLALYGQTYLIAYVGQKVIADLRNAVFQHLQKLSLAYFEQRRTGAIMSRLTNDVGVLQNAITSGIIDLVTEGIALIGSIGFMIYIDWKLTLLTLFTMPFVAYTIQSFGRKIRQASGTIQEKASDITSVLQETISAIRVVKSFARENYEIDRFGMENYRNFRAIMRGAQLNAFLTPIVEFLTALGVTAIIWYGGKEVIDGTLSSGALIAYLFYVGNLSNPLKRLSRVVSSIQQAIAASMRVFEVLDTESDITDCPGAISLPPVHGHVQFQNVTFGYNPEEPVLKNIVLTSQPGQVIALVGPSGAGKSTIVNLIPRFYDPAEGYITIDGYDVRGVTLSSLREQVGIVPQETVLFNGSVRDNIRYGKLDGTDAEIEAAARAANAHSFITAMSQGYDSQIGERGTKLSGGQRQRISIARAILKNPRILILDEATSALDTESEKLVQEALERLMVNRTTFVIAHRLSTIQNADKIIVMDKGCIVEIGTHTELLAQNGLYSKLHRVHFKDER
jgi:ATP-binding cassette, subfamily B, bacterial MsbA